MIGNNPTSPRVGYVQKPTSTVHRGTLPVGAYVATVQLTHSVSEISKLTARTTTEKNGSCYFHEYSFDFF